MGKWGMKFIASLGTTAASLNASIQIHGIGIVSGNGSVSATTTVGLGATVGLSKNVNPEPAVQVGPSLQTQSSTTGAFPVVQDIIGELPLNSPIAWSVITSLRAENVQMLLGCTVSWAILHAQSVTLIPLREDDDGDPGFSDSLFSFDASSGNLGIHHPLQIVPVTAMPTATAVADEAMSVGTLGHFMPQIDAIYNGQSLTDQDALFGAQISYPGIVFQGRDGVVSRFSDGQLQFFDRAGTLLAQGAITNIAASSEDRTFGGRIENFALHAVTAAQSPLAGLMHVRGGRVVFDPELIEVTAGLTQTATNNVPFSIVIAPEGSM